MPVVIHWAANFMLGLLTARAVKGAPSLHAGRAPWPLLFLGAWQAVFITPCITYLFRYFPAWSMFYLFDPADYPSLDVFIGMLSALVVAVNFGLMVLGFCCGRRSTRKAQARWAQLPAFGCFATLGLCAALFGDRMAYAGEYETFWRGEAPMFLTTPAGFVGLALVAASAVFVGVLGQRFGQRDPVFI